MDRELKIFSGGSNPELSQKICDYLDIPMGMSTISRFPDGETFIKLDEDVRGRDIFVVQSVVHSPNDYLMELLIYLDCIRRASAQRPRSFNRRCEVSSSSLERSRCSR